MSLNRLAVKAKKSISELFSSSDEQHSSSDETTKRVQNAQESDTPELEDCNPHTGHTDFPYSDMRKGSTRSKDSPSRRKKWIGSLQSMGSLRSIRSPSSKTKRRDDSPPRPTSACTPTRPQTHDVRPSLALNFEESPPGQPVFDIPQPRRSVSSSFFTHHSSPMAVPISTKREVSFAMPIHPSILPAGTIPDSPAPFQKALDMESANLAPSPALSPTLEPSAPAEPIPTPMPGTNLSLEDACSNAVTGSDYFGYFGASPENGRGEAIGPTSFILAREATRNASAKALKELLASKVFEKETASAETPVSGYYTMYWPRANGEISQRLVPIDSDEETPTHGSEDIVWEEDDSDLAAVNQAISVMTRANIATDSLDSNGENELGRNKELKVVRRTSVWGRHAGLYDGTGYGDDAASTSPRESTKGTQEASQVNASTPREDSSNSLFVNVPSDSNPPLSVRDATGDHETLEEVIRAYAGYDEEGISGITDKVSVHDSKRDTETVIVSTVDDAELSGEVLDTNLGAETVGNTL